MIGIAIALICVTAISVTAVALAIRAYKIASEARETACEALNSALEREQDTLRKIAELKELIPEDVREEKTRRDVLMRELNDEMERRVEAERSWNEMVNGILSYNAPAAKAR